MHSMTYNMDHSMQHADDACTVAIHARCLLTWPSHPPVTRWYSQSKDQLTAQTGSPCPTREWVKPPVAGSHSLAWGSPPTTAIRQCVAAADDMATPYTLSGNVKLHAVWPRFASQTCAQCTTCASKHWILYVLKLAHDVGHLEGRL